MAGSPFELRSRGPSPITRDSPQAPRGRLGLAQQTTAPRRARVDKVAACLVRMYRWATWFLAASNKCRMRTRTVHAIRKVRLGSTSSAAVAATRTHRRTRRHSRCPRVPLSAGKQPAAIMAAVVATQVGRLPAHGDTQPQSRPARGSAKSRT